jgi:hypothetical protein
MKEMNFKNNALFLILLLVLFNQNFAQTKTVAQIDNYAKTVSQLMETQKQRIFADVSSNEKKSIWKEFTTEKLRDDADTGENLNENAYVWMKDGKIVSTTFTFQSPSRDWAHFVTYYFRADGTLAKAESTLNTFYGNVTADRNYYFHSKGKILKQNVKYLYLKTQKPINLTQLGKRQNFIDRKVEFFKTTNKLPFIKLINKKQNGR